MKRLTTVLMLLFVCLAVFAQEDRREVRSGNRHFRKDRFKKAEIEYRKAALKDSLSLAAEYNLGSTLYRMDDFESAGKALETVKSTIESASAADKAKYYFNCGDVALQKKDYAAAVDAFRQSLLQNPADLDAKESYIYAKKMLENQQNGGSGQNQNDQNQNQDQNDQNQNQDQNQNNGQDQQNNQNNQGDQNRDDQNDQGQNQERQISPQQAQQMLKAIQAKEKDTQDKVRKEKAEVAKSKQKEKNW